MSEPPRPSQAEKKKIVGVFQSTLRRVRYRGEPGFGSSAPRNQEADAEEEITNAVSLAEKVGDRPFGIKMVGSADPTAHSEMRSRCAIAPEEGETRRFSS